MLAQSTDRFIVQRYGPERRKRLASTDDGFGREEWKAYADLGWLGAVLPVDLGGAGGRTLDLMILMEAVGRGLLMEPFLSSVVLGARLVELAGTQRQREELLAAVAKGRLILAFAHAEPDSGFCREWIATTACTIAGNGYSVTGNKVAVMHGHAADQLIVSARMEDKQGAVGLFLVDPRAPGVCVTGTRGIDDRPVAAVRMENVSVPSQQRLACDDAQQLIDGVLDRATISVCAEALGAIRACNLLTIEHLGTRRQFGSSLSTFQALRHRMVDMVIAETEVRAMVRSGAEAIDGRSRNAAQRVSAAKITMSRAAHFVGGQAVQLHGAIGMTDDFAIGHYYKRLLSLDSAFGDADWHLQRLCSSADIYAEAPAH